MGVITPRHVSSRRQRVRAAQIFLRPSIGDPYVADRGGSELRRQPSSSPSDMAGVAVIDTSRRTRPASMSSSDETDEDDGGMKKPILLLASPSPSRAAGRKRLEPAPKRPAPPRRSRPMRMLDSMCRSLPLFNPSCGRQAQPGAAAPPAPDSLLSQLTAGASPGLRRRLTGTLFGYRNCRISLALQDNARCMPDLVVELAIPTRVLLRDLSAVAGARIVLESEKRATSAATAASIWRNRDHHDDAWVQEEPMWTMFCNGKRAGYAVRREPNDLDVEVLETLWAVSMGSGVLPTITDVHGLDGDMTYIRGSFDHIVGSRDSESLYMVGPPGGDSPELTVFFVRL